MDRPGTEPWRREQAARLLAFGRGSELPEGGFGWLTEHGTVDSRRSRPLYVAARMTYAYALAFLASGDEHARRLASSGLMSLRGRYADRAHNGWYASLDSGGRVDDTTKANYAHAHVLLAASTALAAGIARADEVVEQAAAVIEQRFWAEDEGCAVENWDEGFGTLEPYRGANSNMHSLEAYLVAGDVTDNAVWHARALAIASRLIDVHARAHDWRLPEHYDDTWRPLLDYNRDRPDDQFRPFGWTPGHSFEWARLLIALEATLTDPPQWLLEAARGLFDTAVSAGWAADSQPGFVYTLDFEDHPIVTERLHWVACEAVLAADSLHRRTGDIAYGRYADTWWQHIADHFLDGVNGGWWQELAPTLAPSSTIWSGKPDVYHSYQALLFPSLPLAPCAAVALARRA
ncbi:MAG TPA: AGE family epimerase/isomerase [Jatrophihabitantaceae bacterium]|nr:AGE family epimerase/isomerase [Jatrophihabitantaceae bacterium]